MDIGSHQTASIVENNLLFILQELFPSFIRKYCTVEYHCAIAIVMRRIWVKFNFG